MSSSVPFAAYPPARQAWRVTVMLLAVSVLAYVDRVALTVLVTPIQKDFGLSDIQLGLLLGPAFIILYAVASLPIGYLADRFNRKFILIAGLLLWSAATAACGISRSFESLFAARILVGIGEAALIPCSYSMISDLFPPDRRGKPIAVASMGIGLGTGIALLGGGMLLAALGSVGGRLAGFHPWQMVFLLYGLVGFAMAALFALTTAEPARHVTSSAHQARGGLLIYLRTNALVLTSVLGANILAVFAYGAAASWTPVVLTRLHGLPADKAALLAGLVALALMPIATLVGGHATDRAALKWPDARFRVALMLLPAFLASIFILALARGAFWPFWGVGGIYAIGSVILTLVYAAIQEITPNHLRAQMFALYQLLANIIGVSGGAASVALVTDRLFHDHGKVGLSILIVTTPILLSAIALGIIALRGGRYAALADATRSAKNSIGDAS